MKYVLRISIFQYFFQKYMTNFVKELKTEILDRKLEKSL